MRQIQEPSVWRGADIQDDPAWMHHLTDQEIAEIDAAVHASKAAGLSLDDMTPGNFPVPRLRARLAALTHEIEEGLGLYLLRGFPAEAYDKSDLRRLFWGLGLHCGTAVSQSARGDVLGDVRDLGAAHDGPAFRGYTSNGALTYHTDAADVTGLFCLRPAKRGGLSRIVSLGQVHNEILASRPDLLKVLYEPYPWGRQGNELPGQSPYYTQPIFAVHDGKFAGRYTRTHIRTAELGGVCLTDPQAEALDLIDAICARPGFALSMMFQAGDIQFLNNHLTLHTRTAFEDDDDPDRKRHMLRLWLSPSNSRALAPGFGPFFRDTRAGAVRGGFPGHGKDRHFQTS